MISVPFQRIAVDIVGPLLRSSHENQCVLVVCDYATRYPEAMAMWSVKADKVPEELVILFARIGIPKEILTNQGINFTSMLLQELYRLLHMHHIHTSPYHPQTDVLIEWFNQTLKMMLRKTAVEDYYHVLITYCEVPQSSTILVFQAVVRTCTEGTVRWAEGAVERKGEEFRKCYVTHPDDAGQNGGDEGACDGEHGKGTNNPEEVV